MKQLSRIVKYGIVALVAFVLTLGFPPKSSAINQLPVRPAYGGPCGGDNVCVTPGEHLLVIYDNSQADSRIIQL